MRENADPMTVILAIDELLLMGTPEQAEVDLRQAMCDAWMRLPSYQRKTHLAVQAQACELWAALQEAERNRDAYKSRAWRHFIALQFHGRRGCNSLTAALA